jgi:hypothetical protein
MAEKARDKKYPFPGRVVGWRKRGEANGVASGGHLRPHRLASEVCVAIDTPSPLSIDKDWDIRQRIRARRELLSDAFH